MKVGLAGFGYGLGSTGGTQVYLRDLEQALARWGAAGNRYTLLLGADEPAPPAAPALPVQRVPVPPAAGFLRRARRVLLGAAGPIDALGLDLLHCPATRVPDALPRTPIVLTFFDMQEEFLPGAFTWRERLARRVLHRRGVRRAAAVVAPSRFTAECLSTRYGTPAAKIHLVAPGVGERFYAPRAGERELLRDRYGLEAGGFVLYPANPWPHKNHARLVRAVARLGGGREGVPLLVCTGRLAGETRRVDALAAQAGLGPERVRDLGFVAEADLPVLLRAARLLVFPSLFEGFGLPVAEALAAGCPVACAAIPPLAELTGGAALLFDPLDEGAIAASLAALWNSGSERGRLAAAGRERAEAFRWRHVVPRLEAVYAAAASRATRSGGA